MPKRIVKTPVQVFRDGAWVEPKVGEPFDFTDKELADINSVNADAIEHIVTEEAKPAAAEAKAKV